VESIPQSAKPRGPTINTKKEQAGGLVPFFVELPLLFVWGLRQGATRCFLGVRAGSLVT